MIQNDEQELVRRLKDPHTQRKAFDEIVRAYSETMYWQVRRIVLTHEDANDVIQKCLHQGMDTYRLLSPGFQAVHMAI